MTISIRDRLYGCDVDRIVKKAKHAAEGSKVLVLENAHVKEHGEAATRALLAVVAALRIMRAPVRVTAHQILGRPATGLLSPGRPLPMPSRPAASADDIGFSEPAIHVPDQREALTTHEFPDRDICRRPALRRRRIFPIRTFAGRRTRIFPSEKSAKQGGVFWKAYGVFCQIVTWRMRPVREAVEEVGTDSPRPHASQVRECCDRRVTECGN
jgi:hypothetical protein